MRTYILGQILHILATRRQGQAFGKNGPLPQASRTGRTFCSQSSAKEDLEMKRKVGVREHEGEHGALSKLFH